jgi:cytochrome c biogenesis protein CcdA
MSVDYGEIEARYNSAYTAFRSTYTTQHPQPTAQQFARRNIRNNKSLRRFLIALVIASIIVSGSHTIPTFAESLPDNWGFLRVVVGLAAFAMVELGVILYAYQRVEKSYQENANYAHTIKHLMGIGMGLGLVVALGANLYSSLKPIFADATETSAAGWDVVQLIVFILVGISAPILAFIAGEVFGMLDVEERQARAKTIEDYENALLAWEEGLRVAWGEAENQWGARVKLKVERPSAVRLSDTSVRLSDTGRQTDNVSDKQSDRHGHGVGYTRRHNAMQMVIDHLNAQPEAATLTARQLAEVVGVAPDTANKGKRAWQQAQQGATNE